MIFHVVVKHLRKVSSLYNSLDLREGSAHSSNHAFTMSSYLEESFQPPDLEDTLSYQHPQLED